MADLASAVRVWETTTDTSSPFELAGISTAVKGLRTFVDAGLAATDVFIMEVHQSEDEWQFSRATVTDASPDTYVINQVIKSSNSDSQVTWTAGTRDVFLFDAHGYSSGPITTVTGNTTLDESHFLVLCNSAGAFGLTLPPVAEYEGKDYILKTINTGDIAIDEDAGDTNSVETFSGTLGTGFSLTEAGQWVHLKSDGSVWRRIGGNGMTIGDGIAGATAGSVLFVDANGDLAQDNPAFYWDATNDRAGFGTSSPAAGMHGVVTDGAFLWADTEADSTNKVGLWGVESYDTSEEPFYGIIHSATNTLNTLFLGGGSSSGNAATSVDIFLAADTMTTQGSRAFKFDTDGFFLGNFNGITGSNGAVIVMNDNAGDPNITSNQGGIYAKDLGSNDTTPYAINENDEIAPLVPWKQSVTLGAAATTFAANAPLVVVTGDAGANTIATITGDMAHAGSLITLQFVDALVTITDNDAHATDSVDLNSAFTSADDVQLTLVHDGTSWYEVSRSNPFDGNIALGDSNSTTSRGITFSANAAGTAVLFLRSDYAGSTNDMEITIGEWQSTGFAIRKTSDTYLISGNISEVVINESGADIDLRVEGTSDTHLVFVDASTNRVGFGTNAPAYFHDIDGATRINGQLDLIDSSTYLSAASGNLDLRTGGAIRSLIDGGVVQSLDGASVSTTDATVTTLATVATASDTAYHIEAVVVAAQTTDYSEVASYKLHGTFKNDGGTLSLVGSVTADHTGEDTAGWDATLDASGTDIRVRVTGAAATDVNWKCNVKITSVS